MTQYQPHLSPPLVQRMTSCFVEFPSPINYGTRTHTVVMINGAGLVTYLEQNLDDYVTNKWSTGKINFRI
uniref:Uncharacterized protein n=1 Tax=Romanomermis culicivorax TaxID=13658 RepID=A0A915L8X9_ROMCU